MWVEYQRLALVVVVVVVVVSKCRLYAMSV
jgi:hypothetical protein